MRIDELKKVSLFLLLFSLGLGARAGEWEIGGSIARGPESKGNIGDNGAYPTVPYTMVRNSIKGAWTQGGVHVGYRVFHRGAWGTWLQAEYSAGLSHPEVNHSGENYAAGSTIKEVFNGTASYKSLLLGVRVSRTVPIGEFGVSIGSRSHDLSAEGQRQGQVNGVFTSDQYTLSHAYRDVFASLSFTLKQDQGRYRSFQRISLGTGFGSSIPSVDPGPNDWRMSEAYLAQFRPNTEIRITLGVRL